MKYNINKYNLGKFNTSSGESSNLRLFPLKHKQILKKPVLKKSPKLKPKPIKHKQSIKLLLKVSKPLKTKKINHIQNSRFKLSVSKPLKTKPINHVLNMKKIYIKSYGLDVITLTKLVLLPGETLIIDTDAVTVEKDGTNVIEFWETGSNVFNMNQGTNTFSITSSDNELNANVTTIWRERWL